MQTDAPTTPTAAPTAVDPAATPTTSRAAINADLTTACDTPDFKEGMRIRDSLGQVGVLTSKVTRVMGGGKYDWNLSPGLDASTLNLDDASTQTLMHASMPCLDAYLGDRMRC